MKTLYCYGDSNTWGYDGASLLGERYPGNIRWTGILKEKSGYRVVNDGMNGRCIPTNGRQTDFLVDCIGQELQSTDTLILWIMLGTNDLLNYPDGGAENVAVRMAGFLEKLAEYPVVRENVRIRLISPAAISRGSWVETESLVEQSLLLGNAMQKIAVAHDIDFTDAGGMGIPLLSDGVHFTAEGHRIFAENMLKVLTKTI